MGTFKNNIITRYTNNYSEAKKSIPPKIAAMGERQFENAFRTKSWEGNPWKDRKDKKNNRSLLVRSGELRRNAINSTRQATFKRIKWGVYLPYAAIHNYGGVINKKASVKTLNFRVYKNGKSRFTKKEKANFQADYNVAAHSITIPARPFMGLTNKMIRKAENIMVNEMRKGMR